MNLPRDHIFAGLPGAEVLLDGGVTLFANECMQTMARMPEASIDACVVDPPYHLTSVVKRFGNDGAVPAQYGIDGRFSRLSGGFMNAKWDGGDIAFRPETWAAVYRVLKPGAHLAAFGGPRTFHRMMVAIEDAGFELRDTLMWVYSQGFPKSYSLNRNPICECDNDKPLSEYDMHVVRGCGACPRCGKLKKEFEGFGTALKPSYEPVALFRKPLSEGTVAANVLRWGTGALNIDGCRVEAPEGLTSGGAPSGGNNPCFMSKDCDPRTERGNGHALGRWPANLVHDGSDEVVGMFPQTASGNLQPHHKRGEQVNVYGASNGAAPSQDFGGDSGSAARFFYQAKPDGNGRDGEPSADRRYTDEGSTNFAALPGARRDAVTASRLFYTAKADADDRLGSKHPTIKPLDLMAWLVRLVCPPGGMVLDCFAGTGTTGEAAWREGMRAVLIEAEPQYQDDIRRRMQLAATAGAGERERESIKAAGKLKTVDDLPLFATSREAAE
jgi:DNA modification methylase